MEKFNQALFLFLTASEHPSAAVVALAQGLANYAIWIVPAVLILGCCMRPTHHFPVII